MIQEFRGVDVDIDAVPARRRRRPSRCCAGATRSACSSSRAGRCARSCARSRPTSFEDVAALVALYRPGPMAANMHNDYADRKNGRKPVAYFHPDAEELLADTYGLMIYQESVMRVAQKFAGYSLAEADNLRKAMGKKKRERHGRRRRQQVRRGLRGHRLRRGARRPSSSTSSSSSPTTPSTSRTPTATASSPTRPPTSRPTTRSSTSPPCSPASRPTSTRPRSTSPSAGPWASRCSCPTSTGRRRTSSPPALEDGERGHPLRPVRGAQRRQGAGRAASSPSARPRPVPRLLRLLRPGRPARCSTSGRVESLIKAGAFDSLGHPRKGLLAVFEGDHRQDRRPAAARSTWAS